MFLVLIGLLIWSVISFFNGLSTGVAVVRLCRRFSRNSKRTRQSRERTTACSRRGRGQTRRTVKMRLGNMITTATAATRAVRPITIPRSRARKPRTFKRTRPQTDRRARTRRLITKSGRTVPDASALWTVFHEFTRTTLKTDAAVLQPCAAAG